MFKSNISLWKILCKFFRKCVHICTSNISSLKNFQTQQYKWLLLFISILLAVGIFFVVKWTFSNINKSTQHHNDKIWVNPTVIHYDKKFRGSYNKVFNDLNPLHLEAAEKWGIVPEEIERLIEKDSNKLIRVESTPSLKVANLNYSIPYLVPIAYNLINDISKDFCKILKQKKIPSHRLIATSFTRTRQQSLSLNKVNLNSSEKSAHCYGTTFDISWSKYDPIEGTVVSDAILKKLLAVVLDQYRIAGRCYIKHERKQACFHITAIGTNSNIEYSKRD